MDIKRRRSREIRVGSVKIGGDAPISVQSMTNTDTRDIESTIRQINILEEVGCEIVRIAILDKEAAKSIEKIKPRINIPLIADIHFNYRLALESISRGADGIRINPGNIGSRKNIKSIILAAKDRGISIRIGVNAGSLEGNLLKKYGYPNKEALLESALNHIKFFEDVGFFDIKISIKSSDVLTTIDSYRLIAERVDYPLHLGVTEAGTLMRGSIKSAIGIGALLLEGIGDTIRVSLTGNPVQEVKAGYEILRALNIRYRGVNIISCPTCGRMEIDLVNIVEEIERRLSHIKESLNVAVLGCVVNGIGEAKEADIGIAGGRGTGILFKNGKIIKKVKEEELVDTLVNEVERMVNVIH
jgi:(E)-4-hydroxy-3-methylbut-2-enyl-diphosphate synthase